MQNIFENVQIEFMTLMTLLEGIDFEKETLKDSFIDKVNDALCNTYIVLNQGFCESKLACKKCAENRDELEALIRLMDEAEANCHLKEELYVSLARFRTNIPKILVKMETVYLESFNKVY